MTSRTADIFDLAKTYIPGGINTAIRALDPPMVFTRAEGACIYDADGRGYIDYHAAFGPPILGHCHPGVNRAVFETLSQIDLIGVGTTELEARLAQKIVQHVPSAEKVLFCNSGSEATFSAIRLAKAVTGKQKLIKFQGCYHGHHDAVLMNVITPADKMGQRDILSAGVTPEVAENTIVLQFNNLDEVEAAVQAEGDSIAAIILEQIPHNIGCVMPQPGFLEGLRQITRDNDIILIFDEVVTGFRHTLGGYQAVAGVTPDLTTMGKAMANGYPIAAVAGRADLMDRYATAGGDVFFAGTYNAHPVGTSASLATIEALEDGTLYQKMFRQGDYIRGEMQAMVDRLGIEATVVGFGSIWLTYFMSGPIESYTDLLRNDGQKFMQYRRGMVERGIFELPLNLKRNHISAAHTDAHIDDTLNAAEDVLRKIGR